jgi:hypothetical protein
MFAWTRRQGARIKQFAVNEATQFAWNGTEIFHAVAPLTLAADLLNDSVAVFVVDSLARSTEITVGIANIKECLFNGSPIEFSLSPDGSVVVKMQTGGTLLLRRKSPTSVRRGKATGDVSFELGNNYPNPFNPDTRLTVHLPESGNVSVRVTDLLGRTVIVLAEGRYPAGSFVCSWNGKNEMGEKAASGVYIFELRSDAGAQRTKGVLLR